MSITSLEISCILQEIKGKDEVKYTYKSYLFDEKFCNTKTNLQAI